MKLFLFLILIVAGEGAYFEYTTEKRLGTGTAHQLGEWQAKVDALEAKNKKLKAQGADITHSLGMAQAQDQLLSRQLQDAQAAESHGPSSPTPMAATSSAPTSASASSALDLGTISTIIGKTYQNCKLLKVQADGIVISHSQGIIKVLFAYLPPEMQRRFGYDPNHASALDEATVRYQEQLRQAASSTPAPPQ